MNTAGISEKALVKMGKFAIVVENGSKKGLVERQLMLDINGGILRHSAMYHNEHDVQWAVPSACEVDIPGVIAMYALGWHLENPVPFWIEQQLWR